MDSAQLAHEESVPLSDDDLRTLLGRNLAIMRYPDLQRAEHVEDVLDDEGRALILYLIDSPNSGHWQCVYTTGPKHLAFFDSYGMRPDKAFGWTTDEEEQALGQTRHELTRLLKDAVARGWDVKYNTHCYQSKVGDIATCGRHCAVRIMLRDLSAIDYFQLVTNNGRGSADQFVTAVTRLRK
jgi:hypothetical protein